MRYQDQIVKLTQKALDDICRAAEAVPESKSDWAPGAHARSTLHQMQEIATSATWFIPVIESGLVPVFNDETRKEHTKFRKKLQAVRECVEEARQSTGQLCQAILAFPEGKLEDEVTLPFGSGSSTMADVLALHYWNMVYHLGQINQIQLLLGDPVMH